MNLYEVVVITKQSYVQNNVEEVVQKLISKMSDEGELVKYEHWGLKNFCYIVKRKRRGHYILIYVKCSVKGLDILRRKIFLDENILRHLVIAIKNVPEDSSPILQSEESKETSNLML